MLLGELMCRRIENYVHCVQSIPLIFSLNHAHHMMVVTHARNIGIDSCVKSLYAVG
jgi:hypothetical protein